MTIPRLARRLTALLLAALLCGLLFAGCAKTPADTSGEPESSPASDASDAEPSAPESADPSAEDSSAAPSDGTTAAQKPDASSGSQNKPQTTKKPSKETSTTNTTTASSGGKQKPRLVTNSLNSKDVFVVTVDATQAPFSADKTGKKDATEAIQNAINKCQTTYGGGIVYLPAGTYKVTGTVTVKGQVTLKGDYSGSAKGVSGTVISAETTKAVFALDGSAAGVNGLTVYYPKQSASSPVKADYTILANDGGGFTVSDVTLLNSYKGIGVGVTGGHAHGLATVSRVRGTVLHTGLAYYYGAEVDVVENVNFAPSFWASAGSKYHAPSESAIRSAMKGSTGFVISGCEDVMISDCTFDGFATGIATAATTRSDGAESYPELYRVTVKNAETAVELPYLYTDMGALFAECTLEGSNIGIVNTSSYTVKLFNCTVKGKEAGMIEKSTASVTVKESSAAPAQPTKKSLFVVTDYGADDDYSTDDTAAFEKALAAASKNGGGYVYIPGGAYLISRPLTVPANTRLIGTGHYVSGLENTPYAGVALFCTYGEGKSDTDTAFITLNGKNAGAMGFKIYYPKNGMMKSGKSPKAYAYAIRGKASGCYVVNIGMFGCWNGVEMSGADNFVVRRLTGAFHKNGIHIKNSNNGIVDACLANGGQQAGGNYGFEEHIAEWETDVRKNTLVFTRNNLTFLKATGSSGVFMRNNFVYRGYALLESNNSKITAVNMYSSYNKDYQYYVTGGSLTVVNNYLKQSKIAKSSGVTGGIYNISSQMQGVTVSEKNITF